MTVKWAIEANSRIATILFVNNDLILLKITKNLSIVIINNFSC
ncbi:hypothetical protein OSCI_3320012 [Kamptonema sp. PCC 6506]|nr:hypothetical protein OSCI_3320012 [Kamptonema sp. PCC 6506]